MTTSEWYTTVHAGRGPYTMPPRGPWRGEDAAYDAMARWRGRVGHMAGTICAAHSVGLAGPYSTRRAARAADISTARAIRAI